MKKMKNLFMVAVAIVLFAACDKEGDQVKLIGGSSDITLSISSTADLTLTKAQENFNSLQFQWTNPGYRFSNGVNTQDITYTLQIDRDGGDFTGAKVVNLEYKSALSTSFKVKELNNALAGVELPDGPLNSFQFRVRSVLPGSNAPLFSNIVKMKIATYLDVVFPVPANLYITGAATPASWMSGGDPENVNQKFTKVNPFTFVINSLQITGNSPFLFVPVYGNWDNKYGFTGAKEANNPMGDTFRPGGEDLKAPAQSKAYKITVNFKTGKYTFE
jgi:starch-binding outer membrane protein SusE/F